jgi:1-acyl-sn-glycerol-3-phosphate acyltransferase
MHNFSKFIFFTFLRWKFTGSFPKDIKKYIIIVAPHTSWIDFPVGLLIRSITKLQIHFVGKKSLFKLPHGIFFRKLGGFPIDRTKATNTVEILVDKFKKEDEFILGISPEGTRKKVEKWKTGFYYVATLANVPIVKVALDFEHKNILIDAPFYPTDNPSEDLVSLKYFYNGINGRHPDLS